jgi:dienelactone hydrolase
MRGRLIITALLALALHGCGSGDSSNSETPAGAQKVAIPSTTVAAGKDATKRAAESPPADDQAAEPAKPEAEAAEPATATFVPAKASGPAPAVVFVHDLAAGEGEAMEEAKRLAPTGIASLVLTGEHGASADAKAFAADVKQVAAAIAVLRKRPDVDPDRIALVGEGNGARVAAVILGEERGRLRGAVLADLGVAGGGGGRYAPERWLEKARGSMVMLQRSLSRDRTTDAELKQLLLAAPPGTLVYDYKELDRAAQQARDRWLRKVLA